MLEVKDIKNKKYSLISEFPKANIAVVRHNLCGYKYEVHTSKFVNGKERCPLCTHGFVTEGIFKKKNKKILKDFELSDYKNLATPALFTHKECLGITERTPQAFIENPTCFWCSDDWIKAALDVEAL
ncbi:hypothetical protein AB0X79_07915 [Pediococcus pentosaceus]|uniref:hypothetical protein n=1 Tax=Pediococcus pentosaceus TaxID=1255 RepID=UPI003F23C676